MSCLFPKRSVIQLHHLDVLLKRIMDSGGPAWFSSSFTEYTQCYFNLSTWAPCIGNESVSLERRRSINTESSADADESDGDGLMTARQSVCKD